MKQTTKTDALLDVLSDRAWPDTRELVRRVGHSFAGAKFRLVGDRYHYSIEKRRDARKRYQWQYRLVD